MCNGDSGGALVANGEVIGMLSWGRACGSNLPDVFVRISSYVDWINQKAV